MKNMFIKTALTSSLMLIGAGVASAQTTVSGNLALTYKAISNDQSTQKANNFRAFGKESQINIANKGTLTNGMQYAAGFSIELDGNDTVAVNASNTTTSNSLAGAFNENVYIDFISGGTTITIGADHIQNPDYTITNLTGVFDPDDAVSGIAGQQGQLYNPAKNSAYQAYGIGIVQQVGNFGRASINYTPDTTTGSAMGDTNGVSTVNVPATYDLGESQFEVGFRGNLGVTGLDAGVFYNKASSGGEPEAAIGKMAAVRYNFGSASVAYEAAKVQARTGIETDSDSYGVAYAIDKQVSVGYNYTQTKSNERAGQRGSATDRNAKEKISQLTVGYSLGPVNLGLSYAEVDSLRGVSNSDGKSLIARTSVNF
jgi:hypothetical protein